MSVMRNMTLTVVVHVLVVLGSPVLAKEHPNTSAAAIRQQQQEIRAEVVAGQGRYKDMPSDKRAQLLSHQDRVPALLADVDFTTELPEADQIAAFNGLEAIEAIVNAAEDERMICERFKPVRSNRPQTRCRTVAQRRAGREPPSRAWGAATRPASRSSRATASEATRPRVQAARALASTHPPR
jgi:hypothetical protein